MIQSGSSLGCSSSSTKITSQLVRSCSREPELESLWTIAVRNNQAVGRSRPVLDDSICHRGAGSETVGFFSVCRAFVSQSPLDELPWMILWGSSGVRAFAVRGFLAQVLSNPPVSFQNLVGSPALLHRQFK